jgi:hypothetical protein
VKQGATIDFVVDIGKVLNSDQYLWSATIEEQDNANPAESNETETNVWNSTADFPNNTVVRLDAWELLAQVVLCSNEFLFVD